MDVYDTLCSLLVPLSSHTLPFPNRKQLYKRADDLLLLIAGIYLLSRNRVAWLNSAVIKVGSPEVVLLST